MLQDAEDIPVQTLGNMLDGAEEIPVQTSGACLEDAEEIPVQAYGTTSEDAEELPDLMSIETSGPLMNNTSQETSEVREKKGDIQAGTPRNMELS